VGGKKETHRSRLLKRRSNQLRSQAIISQEINCSRRGRCGSCQVGELSRKGKEIILFLGMEPDWIKTWEENKTKKKRETQGTRRINKGMGNNYQRKRKRGRKGMEQEKN